MLFLSCFQAAGAAIVLFLKGSQRPSFAASAAAYSTQCECIVPCTFYVHYALDGEQPAAVLAAEDYNRDASAAWVYELSRVKGYESMVV